MLSVLLKPCEFRVLVDINGLLIGLPARLDGVDLLAVKARLHSG